MRHAVLRANTVRTDSKPRLASPSRLRFVCSVVYSQMAGGPHIDMRYGRVDAPSADFCTPDGRLPGEEFIFPERRPSTQTIQWSRLHLQQTNCMRRYT